MWVQEQLLKNQYQIALGYIVTCPERHFYFAAADVCMSQPIGYKIYCPGNYKGDLFLN